MVANAGKSNLQYVRKLTDVITSMGAGTILYVGGTNQSKYMLW